METIRILVADDHPIVRDGLVAILSGQQDFVVVGEAADGAEALRLTRSLRPNVLLLDLSMPRLDGVGVLLALRDAPNEPAEPDERRASSAQTMQSTASDAAGAGAAPTQVIVFTAYDTDERILAAVRAGAKGYLLKGAPREEIFRAVRVAYAGGSLLAPIVASKLLRQIGRAPAAGVGAALTPRERATLALLARGLQNKEIAHELAVTERTAKFHVGAVLRKLGAGNRTEAVARAAQQGLIQL